MEYFPFFDHAPPMSPIMSTRHSFLRFSLNNLLFSFLPLRLPSAQGFRHFARNARYSQLARSTSGSRTERSRTRQFGETRVAVGERRENCRRRAIRAHRTLRCTRGRRRARDGMAGTSASGRCSYHLVAEPYHPPGHHPSTHARSLPPPVPQE
jgi:hypothetical protein